MGRSKGAEAGRVRRRRGGGRGRTQLFVGLLLFAPAAVLVAGGDLSVDDAMMRFGGAAGFALVASLVLAAVTRPSGSSDPRPPSSAIPAPAPAPAPADRVSPA